LPPFTLEAQAMPDFVPEPYPRPGWYAPATEPLPAREGAAGVRECPHCGALWDGDGPESCPDCEDYFATLPGAVWDEPEGDW
jgi:hypothetical protein